MRMMVVLAAGGSVELSVLSRCVGRFPEGRVPRRRRVVLGLSTDSSTGLRSIQRTICGRAALTATHCNTLQHTATHCTTLHHTAPHCTTLQRTATHCNALQHAQLHLWHIFRFFQKFQARKHTQIRAAAKFCVCMWCCQYVHVCAYVCMCEWASASVCARAQIRLTKLTCS